MTAGPLTAGGSAVEDLSRLLAQMPRPAGAEYVAALEDELAVRFQVRHAVAVSSGTAALHTALLCLGIGPGDEVLVPALSVVMSVAPIIHAGARPVFVDCDRHGRGLDLDDLAAKVTGATKAILPVHLWGRQGDPARLAHVAAAHGLVVIEDACQAQGSSTDGRVVGTNGDVGCFSLKDGKIFWCGEGGYLLTDRDDIAGRARALRAHHLPPYHGQPETAGYNYRLAEPLAIIARANLARFDDLLDHRRHQAQQLADLLTTTPGMTAASVAAAGDNGYSALIWLDLDRRRAFCEHLARLGVPNSVGTFGLMAADRRAAFARYASSPCSQAATVIDRTLAVTLTDHDTEERINGYAQTISREASTWATHR